MTTARADGPYRRTRPKDRKQHILTTAAELFRNEGFHNVGMSDIAAGVGIVPSALYRHYRNKHDLLVASFDESVRRYEEAVDGVDDPLEMTRSIVHVATASQALDLAWSRDNGHLDPDERAAILARIRTVADRAAGIVGADSGPDRVPAHVTTWAMLAVVNWPGHRPLSVSHADQPRMLMAAANAIVTAGRHAVRSRPSPDSAPGPVRSDPAGGLMPLARREALLNTAITMFAVSGYPNVSLDDIGEAVGIAGPSVYNHFGSKLEILVCGIRRAFDVMWLELGQVLGQTADPARALDQLLSGYARFAYAHWDLIAVLLSHTVLLDDDSLALLARTYLEYVSEWRRLQMMCRPELSADEAQTLVDLALAVINGVVRVEALRVPTLPDDACHLAKAVLDASLVEVGV
ncbi:TetR/AcrR family transcriptional regulator [Gordonia insulae]|uniref:Transcriptional repressor Mce3R n=1 Tax=Gordonia insulae TaxID=2420509 RepID=A0A3G8JRX2_9ACTN|nr:TetR/AcrR family transcriptional regulator [Gordonia insulae]AZG46930.1 Transcriptional repressor Mce3R [Gordonia insulae]